MQIPHDFDSVGNARARRAPVIFLLSEKDEVVAARCQKLVVDAYAGKKRIITPAKRFASLRSDHGHSAL